MEYVLIANALSKEYGHFKALNGLSMHVPKGAIYGFVGKMVLANNTYSANLRPASTYIWRLHIVWDKKHRQRNYQITQTNGSRCRNSVYLS